jgi:hypothetical protein
VAYALSPKTKILHSFELEALQKQARAFEEKAKARRELQLVESSAFWRWLRGQKKPCLKVHQQVVATPSYRIVFGGGSPLSTEGSLAKGGRFNIGGAQLTQFGDLKTFKMRACLYTASTAKCALAEVGDPLGAGVIHKIAPMSPMVLWDLSTVLKELAWPDLESKVSDTVLGSDWGLQKIPTVSQILASHLRDLGGQGLVYPSTKDPSALNIAYFIEQDMKADVLFSSSQIESDPTQIELPQG